MKKYISAWSVIFLLIITVTSVMAIYGFITDDWEPFAYGIIILFSSIAVYLVYGYFDDRINLKSKVYRNFEEGDIIVNFNRSEYSIGVYPVFINLGEICVAKIYRGASIQIPLPFGSENVVVYVNMKNRVSIEKIDEESPTYNIWFRNESDNSLEVTRTQKGDVFDQTSNAKAYESRKKFHKSFNLRGLLFGIPALFVFIWLMMQQGII